MATVEQRFATDHPAAQGHFPGNPIIPGAVLLSEALSAIEAALGVGPSPCQVKSAKFVRPTRPGDRVTIEYSGFARRGIRFVCAVGGQPVLSGEVTYGSGSKQSAA